jgi:hypothetical protein
VEEKEKIRFFKFVIQEGVGFCLRRVRLPYRLYKLEKKEGVVAISLLLRGYSHNV